MAPKPKVKDIKKWVAALRSGEYAQGKHRLHNADGYCCLGVACKIFIDKPIVRRYGFIDGGLPSAQPDAPEWLKNLGTDIRFKGDEEEKGLFLSYLNDELNYTFDEIADILELAYIHEAIEVAYD